MCTNDGATIESPIDLVLYRHVQPNWLTDEGEPSSQAFWPWREIDNGCLSVDRGNMATAAESHNLRTASKPTGFGVESAGVWGLSIGEVASVGLKSCADPVEKNGDQPANPAHAVIEFGDLVRKKREKIGRQFKGKAIDRGRLHP